MYKQALPQDPLYRRSYEGDLGFDNCTYEFKIIMYSDFKMKKALDEAVGEHKFMAFCETHFNMVKSFYLCLREKQEYLLLLRKSYLWHSF